MPMDLHSHILPGIDDGSASLEETLEMLRMEAKQGIDLVVATPHFYPDRDKPEKFLRERTRAAYALHKELLVQPSLPKVLVGAEVYYFRGISESAFLPQLTIGKSNCLLVEMPPAPWPEECYRELAAIREKQGLIPIVAHIDRYIRPLRTYGIPERLAQLPVYVQANAEFFLEKRTASMALKLLKAGQIHFLGSDCHNTTTRKPNLGPAEQYIREKLGPGPLMQIRKTEREILLSSAHRRTE